MLDKISDLVPQENSSQDAASIELTRTAYEHISAGRSDSQSVNKNLPVPAGKDAQTLEQLQQQIEAHEKEDASRSVLKRAVGSLSSVFVKDDASLEKLRTAYREQQKNLREGKAVDTAAIQTLIKNDRDAAQTQSEVVQYGSQFFKTAGLFMPGKFGLAGTLGVYMLDQINPRDSFKDQLIDATLGAAKGAFMKGSFALMANKPVGIAAKGVGLGVSSRILDLGLTRQTYLDPTTGEFSLGKGLADTLRASLNKTALATDVVIFGAAHGLLRGANGATLGRIDKSPLLSTMFTGTTFGMSAGATGEVMRQHHEGERFDLGKVLKRGLIQGGLDTFAALPGGIQADPHVQSHLRKTMRTGADKIQMRLDGINTSFKNLAGSMGLDSGLTLAPAGIPTGLRLSDFGPKPGRSVKHQGFLHMEPVDPTKLSGGSGANSDKILGTPERTESAAEHPETPLQTVSPIESATRFEELGRRRADEASAMEQSIRAAQDVLSKQAVYGGRPFDVVGIDLPNGTAILRDPLVDINNASSGVPTLSVEAIDNVAIKPLVGDQYEYFYDNRAGTVYQWSPGDVLIAQPELRAVPRESFRLRSEPLNGQRPVSSRELEELNPGRHIAVGERYAIRNRNGHAEEGWRLEPNRSDGRLHIFKEGTRSDARLIMFKEGAIRSSDLSTQPTLNVAPKEQRLFRPGELDSDQIALRDGPMGLEFKLGNDWVGQIERPDGPHQEIVFRLISETSGRPTSGRLRKEMAAYQLNQMLGFDNGFPVTVPREYIIDDWRKHGWVQAKSGTTFGDRLRELATDRYGSNSDDDVSRLVKEERSNETELGKQTELAFVERLIYGNGPGAYFVIVETPSGPKVQSIGLGKAFFNARRPHWGSLAYGKNSWLRIDLYNQPLAEPTLSKISTFVGNYDSLAGREQLAKTGLTPREIEGVLSRARWFTENRKFPPSR